MMVMVVAVSGTAFGQTPQEQVICRISSQCTQLQAGESGGNDSTQMFPLAQEQVKRRLASVVESRETRSIEQGAVGATSLVDSQHAVRSRLH